MGARIVSFEANPTKVRAGQVAKLTWETTGARGVDIEPGVGLQPPSGEATVRPITTTTYTLAIRAAGAELTSQVTVEVEGGPPRINSFTATPRTIERGGSSHLEWSTANTTRVSITPDIGADER